MAKPREHLATMWRHHVNRPFPPRLRGEEIQGVDMVMLDADIAGCVTTWLGSTGHLDTGRQRVLRDGLADLHRIVATLTDPAERDYYTVLGECAEAVLAAHPHREDEL